VLVALTAGLVSGVGTAGATNECRALNPCVPVHGPWVIVPVGNSVPRPQVQYVLTCPKGYVVGGLDAELTDRAIDVSFTGKTGSPVNPGITTSRTALFTGTYVGGSARAPSFRPHIGCITGGGGGPRTPTSVTAVVPPGEPTVRHVKTAQVYAGVEKRIAVACASGERLIATSVARGFYMSKPPTQQQARDFVARPKFGGNRIVVNANGGAALIGLHAVLQVTALCAGGR
jgi:hypothetical protein